MLNKERVEIFGKTVKELKPELEEIILLLKVHICNLNSIEDITREYRKYYRYFEIHNFLILNNTVQDIKAPDFFIDFYTREQLETVDKTNLIEILSNAESMIQRGYSDQLKEFTLKCLEKNCFYYEFRF